ncbi:MAG: ADP-forming succinate--CoA ligase subunit beta [Gammaproteobacteria bacterium]|jgi:succinyl-CoA synthetase beta subunit|nr:ADP-forming succinate--CoA ligase subunit beta [Gammaproteobacteria bacterium]
MNLHEYQAKRIFADYGLPVPKNIVARSVDEAINAMNKLDGNKFVVKAQVHAGGRGKAGGVKIVSNRDELENATRSMLHSRLVTYQTDSHGQPINEILIEEVSSIKKELYVGAVLDRSSQRVVIMASTEGGVDIEKVASETPEKIIKLIVDPLLGVMPYQCRDVGFALGLNLDQIKQLTTILTGLGKMFVERDLSLIEVNPLVITDQGNLLCLDGKINIDDNALYRQPKLHDMRDTTQEDTREIRAREWELSYIALDGNIGCMVNGAGLAMATMDLIKLQGGEPANFLDVGGGATKERVSEAFKIILSDKQVKGVLVNIFGGIVRCDLIAEGIIGAVSEVGITVPVVVRLEGNHAKEASVILQKSGLNIIAANDLTDAAKRIVNEVKG